MTGLPIPQTTPGLPPAQWSLPFSPVLADPLFGTYPSERRAGLFVPSTGPVWATSPYLQYIDRITKQLMEQNIGTSLDPESREWTLEEAEAQTERGIAKIATANPELAKELLARREGLEPDKGFWGTLKDLVGDMMAPAISIGGRLLDILARPGRIIPELLADKGDDPWYQDVWQALTGQVTTIWSDVLEEWGVDSPVWRGLLGFVLDVATDPLTYVTFGTAGIGRKMAMDVAAEVVATRVGIKAAEELGKTAAIEMATGKSIGQVVLELYDDLTRVTRPFTSKPAGVIDDEVAAFLASQGVHEQTREIAAQMLEAADVVHRLMGIGGLRNMPKEIALMSGRTLTRSEVMGILEQARRVALFDKTLSTTKRAYQEAKAAAGALGGWRFRFSVPFLDLRYISPAVPISLDTPFGTARRFLTGTSAGKTLLQEVNRGTAKWEDFVVWAEGGLKALAKANPELFARLRGRGFNLGSIYYTMAETVGTFTAHLTPHAKMFRGGGILAAMAGDLAGLAKTWREHIYSEGWTWVHPNGQERATVEQMVQRMMQLQHMDPARRAVYIRFLEEIPNRWAYENLDAWWDMKSNSGDDWLFVDDALDRLGLEFEDVQPGAPLPAGFDESEVAEVRSRLQSIAQRENELEELKRFLSTLSDDEKETLLRFNELWAKMRDLANREGARIGDIIHDWKHANMIRPSDVPLWTKGSRADITDSRAEAIGTKWYIPFIDPDRAGWARNQGVSDTTKVHTGSLHMGHGVYLESQPRRVGVDYEEALLNWTDGLTVEYVDEAGTKVIRGWHGTDSGEIVWRGVDESDEGPRALHFGTKTAALDRLDDVTQEYSVQFVDRHGEVVHEEIATSRNLNEVITEMENRFEWEQLEREGYRLGVVPLDVEIELPREWSLNDLEEGADLRLIPIEAKGKFLDLSESSASDGQVDRLLNGWALEKQYILDAAKSGNEASTMFRGKSVKLVSDKELELLQGLPNVVRLEDLRNIGYDGVIYWNAIEDRGSRSVAVFNVEETVRSVERVENFEAAVRARNLLVVDLRDPLVRPFPTLLGDQSAELEAIYDEAAKVVDKVYRLRGRGIEALKEEFELAGLQPLLDDRLVKIDEIVTEALKKKGYEGVLRIEKDGTKRLTIFDPQNVKLVSESAPEVVPERGYFPRVLTQAIREVLSGQLPEEEYRRVIYGEPKLIHDLQRAFIHLSIDEAEEEVRALLRSKGFLVPDDVPIFERDILKVHETYIARLTEAIMHETLGFNARRMVALGDMTPGLLGGPAPRPFWRVGKPFSPQLLEAASLEAGELPENLARAKEIMDRSTQRVLKALYRLANTNQRLFAETYAMLDIAAGDPQTLLGKRIRKTLRQMREIALAAQSVWWRQAIKLENKATKMLELADKYKTAAKKDALVKEAKTLLREAKQLKERGFGLDATTELLRLRQTYKHLGDLTTEYLKRGLKEEAAIVRRLDAYLSKVSEAQSEYNRILSRWHAALADVKPALVKYQPDMTGFVKLQVKGLEDWAMPAYIAMEFQNVLDRKGVSWLREQWRRIMALWKEWATIRWPGFHIRNHMGAAFNNLISSYVDYEDYKLAMHIRRALLFDPKWMDTRIPEEVIKKYYLDRVFRTYRRRWLTYGELAARISDMGVGMANARATADVRDAVAAVRKELRRQRLPEFLRDLERRKHIPFTRAFGEAHTDLTENVHRVAAFLGGLKASRGDWEAARAFTMMRHGDYLDLTRAEEFIRDLVPFYKWFRTNFPLQLRTLFEDPAKLTALHKIQDAAFEAAGFDPDETRRRMPEWMRKQFILPVPLPKGEDAMRLIMLDLPAADLYTNASEFFSMFLPLVRPSLEAFVANQNLFTGRPLEGEMVPLAGYFDIPILRDIVAAMPWAQKGADGKIYLPDKIQHLMTTIPVFSRFRDWLFADPNRVKYRMAALMSAVLGMRTFPFDKADITRAELEFYYDEVYPQLEMMRSLGIEFPTVNDLSPWTFQQLGLEVPETVRDNVTQQGGK